MLRANHSVAASAIVLTVASLLSCDSSSVVNHPPVAFAGYDRDAILGEPVALNGNQSYDPDGDALTFSWTAQTPDGQRQLLGEQAVVTYQPLSRGTHLLFLRVHDGAHRSPPDLLALRVRAPTPETVLVARAGANHRIPAGGDATLDGSGSSGPDGAVLEHQWRVVDWPDGVEPDLDFALAIDPTDPAVATFSHLTAAKVGAYVVELRVRAGEVESDPDYVTIGVDGWGEAVMAEAQPAARVAASGEGRAEVNLEARLYAVSGSAADAAVEWWVQTAPEGDACPEIGARLSDGASVEEVPPLTLARLRFETSCTGTWLLFVCPQGSAPACPAPLSPSPACGERAALTASCCCGLGARVMLTVEEVAP